MPRQPSRPRKRKAPEDIPSSATQEVISVVRKGNHIIKKRIVEGTVADPRASHLSFPDDAVRPQLDHSHLRPQLDHSHLSSRVPSNKQDMPRESPKPAYTSRSVSVSATRVCHADTHSSISRPKLRSGSHTVLSSFMNSFIWRLLLK